MKRVVIVGAGFAGLNAARFLAGKPVSVTVIDRNNYHLFQPLLYQVATGTLTPSTIAQPIRFILRQAQNIEVLMDEVTRIDFETRQVEGENIRRTYDFLILATGARHAYFGHPEWERLAPGLKELPDALEMRRRIYGAFEVAEREEDKAARQAALTFVIVGGGPTGVELAGAIVEIARFTLRHDFRRIDPRDARVILIDAAPRLLTGFDTSLSDLALRQIRNMGIEVILDAPVDKVTADGVGYGEQFIRAKTILWAAGNQASPVAKRSGVETDRQGRAVVREDLTLPGYPDVQVLGDCARFEQGDSPLPALAPVAMQQGKHAAQNILRALEGKPLRAFHYQDRGTMATIGRHAGVADLRFVRFGGVLAWFAWLFVHLIFLIGLRNRLAAFSKWVWAYFTFGRHVRLITGRNVSGVDEDVLEDRPMRS